MENAVVIFSQPVVKSVFPIGVVKSFTASITSVASIAIGVGLPLLKECR